MRRTAPEVLFPKVNSGRLRVLPKATASKGKAGLDTDPKLLLFECQAVVVSGSCLVAPVSEVTGQRGTWSGWRTIPNQKPRREQETVAES